MYNQLVPWAVGCGDDYKSDRAPPTGLHWENTRTVLFYRPQLCLEWQPDTVFVYCRWQEDVCLRFCDYIKLVCMHTPRTHLMKTERLKRRVVYHAV